MSKPVYILPNLLPEVDLQTPGIMSALNQASRALAELKGEAKTIPNQAILINTLFLQEAQASSEIENIVTTQDELFQADIFPEKSGSAATKEVARYRDVLQYGYEEMQKKGGVISNNLLIEMFQQLKQQQAEFRNTQGTVLRNQQTGETVYEPPQEYTEIVRLMTALERFINDDDASALDPLIKMALIHYQFESIHPFFDGNGRIGRILNVLYLTRTGLLDTPILYMSREIIRTKSAYYYSLQAVRDDGKWEEWVIYMLNRVARASQEALALVKHMGALMTDFKVRMRSRLPKIYSQDLLNNLFRHPHTRIEFIQKDLDVSWPTASKYLKLLAEEGFVSEHKIGRNKYYINDELVSLLMEVSKDD